MTQQSRIGMIVGKRDALEFGMGEREEEIWPVESKGRGMRVWIEKLLLFANMRIIQISE